jgi:hypothetical protein
VPIKISSPIDGEFKVVAFAGQICAAVVGEHNETLQCRIDWAFARIDEATVEFKTAHKTLAEQYHAERSAYWDATLHQQFRSAITPTELTLKHDEYMKRFEDMATQFEQIEADPTYARAVGHSHNATAKAVREFIAQSAADIRRLLERMRYDAARKK